MNRTAAPQKDVQRLIDEEASKLLSQWLHEKNYKEIQEYSKRISSNSMDMTLWNYFCTFPRLWAFVFLSIFTFVIGVALIPFFGKIVAALAAILALIPWFFVYRTFLGLGAVCKRHGTWRLGSILLKPDLPETRRTVLAAHEVFHSAIALGIIKSPPPGAKIGEEAFATTIEVLRQFEIEGDSAVDNSPAIIGKEFYKAVKEGRIPQKDTDTLIDAFAAKIDSLQSKQDATGLVDRAAAFYSGLKKWDEVKQGTCSFEDFMEDVVSAKGVHAFGHKVGWAKGHGLVSPEFESKIITILVSGDPTEKEVNSLLHGMMVLQCGMWVGHLQKSAVVRRRVGDFIDKLVLLQILTPLEAYDLARRTVEREYTEEQLINKAQEVLGISPK